MSLDNNSANNFQDFLDAIKPYLNYQLYDMSGMGVEAFRFSTDEKPVGQWTDGKLLYAKTIQVGQTSNHTLTQQTGITNADFSMILCGSLIRNGASDYPFTVPTSIAFNPTGHDINDAYSCHVSLSVQATVLIIDCGSSVEVNGGYVTVLYTKTTDSPLASGEKFAGLTSSGEVVYERTISDTINIPNTGYNLDTSTYGINRLLDFEISGEQSGVVYVGRWGMNLQANKQSIKIEPITGNFSVNGTFIIKLRYTKSS